MNIENLGAVAVADAAKGLAVFEWSNGFWCSAPVGQSPKRSYWCSSVSKADGVRLAEDLAAVAALQVGGCVRVLSRTHPRHGAVETVVTRVA